MASFAGFALVLRELRLMHRQPTSRFVLMWLLIVGLVVCAGLSLLVVILVALHRFGLL